MTRLELATLVFGSFLAGAVVSMAMPVKASSCVMVKASWYGAESGNKTATGHPFNGKQWLVAHRTFPFGTKLRLTYNGRSVVVSVLDRGPYIRGRTLDLSAAVARRLGTIGSSSPSKTSNSPSVTRRTSRTNSSIAHLRNPATSGSSDTLMPPRFSDATSTPRLCDGLKRK